MENDEESGSGSGVGAPCCGGISVSRTDSLKASTVISAESSIDSNYSVPDIKLTENEPRLPLGLSKFYSNDMNWKSFTQLVNQHTLSLRLIEYAITIYAVEHSSSYIKNGRPFYISASYKTHLNILHKSNFDPCAREPRILYRGVTTSIKQLQFFYWALSNGVIAWIMKNLDTIKQEKRSRNHLRKRFKKK